MTQRVTTRALWCTLTLLLASSYHTGAFVGAFVLDVQFGLSQGFEVYGEEKMQVRSFIDELESLASAR